jgi:FKBP12-rapamycin complex-associated protein
VALISQIEQSNDAKEREEAVKLINMFVKSAPEIAKSYSTSILSCLIKKLEGEKAKATSTFVSSTLMVISEIAKVNSGAIKPYLGELFPLCLMCIKDQSSSLKRHMALVTLISIIVNTGFVVKPYFYFPELLNTITDLVSTEQNPKIRKLILKLIGTLGAVDPYLVK